jgi:hypothetical protein
VQQEFKDQQVLKGGLVIREVQDLVAQLVQQEQLVQLVQQVPQVL